MQVNLTRREERERRRNWRNKRRRKKRRGKKEGRNNIILMSCKGIHVLNGSGHYHIPTSSHTHTHIHSEQWYRQLCVLVWVLQSMRMDKPAHMTPLYLCWRIDRPPPNETMGRRVAERNKGLMQQWEAMVKQQTKVEEHFLSTSLNSS